MIAEYNALRLKIPGPRRPKLKPEELLDHVNDAVFDILRISSSDVLKEPWVNENARVAQVSHFKVLRATEELRRVGVEARRLRTFMQDIEGGLRDLIGSLAAEGDAMVVEYRARLRWYEHVHARHEWFLERLAVRHGVDTGAGTAEKPLRIARARSEGEGGGSGDDGNSAGRELVDIGLEFEEDEREDADDGDNSGDEEARANDDDIEAVIDDEHYR